MAASRLQVTCGHLAGAGLVPCAAAAGGKGDQQKEEIRSVNFPTQRQEILRWNGWGYKDSHFELNKDGKVVFLGDRYAISNVVLPHMREWMEAELGVDMTKLSPSQPALPAIPPPITHEAFVKDIVGHHGGISADAEDRVFRSHGHTCQEIFTLRHGKPGRVPDLVVFPLCHDHVEAIVKAAVKHNVVLIPFGGGTTVTGAVLCPETETRMIVSLDTSKMNRILWIDHVNMMARLEAGIVGIRLEEKLAEYGVCTGHEPDSQEFSTVGGWVATRASGMKKNIYGNMEDLLISVRIVTPSGTVEKSCQVPRISSGPDINEFILGSEGTLGVVTEVTMKVRKIPEVTAYGSVVFPNFSDGVAAMREIAEARCAPASIRLMDNEQFQFAHALKPAATSAIAGLIDKLKTFYVTKIKGFDPEHLAVATLLFEGRAEDVEAQQERVYTIAKKHGGLLGGEDNGKRGYMLTFVIAYIRDLGFEYKYLGESFETSVPWSLLENLCRNVKDRIRREAKNLGIRHKPLASCRVTQTYDTGACVYFYFGFLYEGLADPLGAFHHIEVTARDEVIANGGSISHHHGVGKVRRRWVQETLSAPGVEMLRAVKEHMDPKNIFANGNLLP
eukprot:m.219489 g.219489  ORF g.219489 m.219489 type:complete len:616 (-) comp10175_c0_seq1:82-1929(-)